MASTDFFEDSSEDLHSPLGSAEDAWLTEAPAGDPGMSEQGAVAHVAQQHDGNDQEEEEEEEGGEDEEMQGAAADDGADGAEVCFLRTCAT